MLHDRFFFAVCEPGLHAMVRLEGTQKGPGGCALWAMDQGLSLVARGAGLLGEGAVQVLYSMDDFQTDPILAAVGALQFEVVQARAAHST